MAAGDTDIWLNLAVLFGQGHPLLWHRRLALPPAHVVVDRTDSMRHQHCPQDLRVFFASWGNIIGLT
ncbi:MAG: hypothetical protein R2851_04860 [Caldilineaceae bacterium]